MALKNPDTNLKYLRLREGLFYIGKDTETPYKELEGRITKMYYKDEEYEGSPVRKLIVRLTDGDEVYQLGLNTDSQNYSTFVSFLKGADINKSITLHPKVEAGEKDGKAFKKNSILVSQDGTYSKGYFTKATPNGAPEWKSVKVGKKTITDKSDYLAFLEEFVTENYINQLQEESPKQVETYQTNKNQSADVVPGYRPIETEEKAESLPWED